MKETPAPTDFDELAGAVSFCSRNVSGIIPVMHPCEPQNGPNPLWAVRGAARIGVAVLASIVVFTHGGEPRKARITGYSVSHGVRLVMPTACIEPIATPCVAFTAVTAAGYRVRLLPILAFVAQVCHSREVAVSRIGGLYGP